MMKPCRQGRQKDSEQILRRNEILADYIQKPLIPGIECVGEIADTSDSSFQKGQRVAALMGGMGRSFNGSYAEYALLPAHHVFAVSSDLPWEKLAAVPKTLSDTLRCVERGGIVCNTGILGGMYVLNGFDPIKDIPNGVYLTGFYSNGPTQEITDEIFTFLTAYHLQPCVGRCFDFSEIREACLAQDRGAVNGKIVVRVTDHG